MTGPWPLAVAGVDAVLRLDGDGGGGLGFLDALHRRGDLEVDQIEEVHAGVQGLADQQLEGALGGLQLVAQVLHLLDAFEQLAAGVFVEPVGEAVLLELVEDVAAAGEVAHQDALAVADRVGRTCS